MTVARRALRSLLAGGTLTAKIIKRGGERAYAVEGETVVGALLSTAEHGHALKMASPRGFEPRLPP